MEHHAGIPVWNTISALFINNINGMQQTFIKELQGNFYLRTPKREKPTPIYYVIVMNGKKHRFATGVKVYPDHWNTKNKKHI